MATRWRPARLKTHKIKGLLIESPLKKRKATKRSQVFEILTYILLGCYHQCRYHNYYYIILTSKITTKMNQLLHYEYPIILDCIPPTHAHTHTYTCTHVHKSKSTSSQETCLIDLYKRKDVTLNSLIIITLFCQNALKCCFLFLMTIETN